MTHIERIFLALALWLLFFGLLCPSPVHTPTIYRSERLIERYGMLHAELEKMPGHRAWAEKMMVKWGGER
jgi:hypothetical protein